MVFHKHLSSLGLITENSCKVYSLFCKTIVLSVTAELSTWKMGWGIAD